jgi:hypothetical protein
MASGRTRTRLARAEVSYSSGLSRNFELVLGPWFVLLGGFLSVVEVLLPPVDTRSDEPPPPQGLEYTPILFVVIGLVFCYLAFFRRVSRIEINDDTLYWFAPFRRLKGQALIADIVSIWTDGTLQWRVTRTGFDFRDDRTISIRDRKGIGIFVAVLVARSPDINVANWEPHEPGGPETIGSSYPSNGDY